VIFGETLTFRKKELVDNILKISVCDKDILIDNFLGSLNFDLNQQNLLADTASEVPACTVPAITPTIEYSC
jgi:hypothetical protein